MSLHGDPATTAGIIIFTLGILIGMSVPFRYGVERLHGLGRWGLSKLPYKPPPGMDEEEAMQQAVEEEEEEGQ